MFGIQPVDLGSAAFKDLLSARLYGVADADLLKELLGRLVRSEHEDAALARSLDSDQGRRADQRTYIFVYILLKLRRNFTDDGLGVPYQLRAQVTCRATASGNCVFAIRFVSVYM